MNAVPLFHSIAARSNRETARARYRRAVRVTIALGIAAAVAVAWCIYQLTCVLP